MNNIKVNVIGPMKSGKSKIVKIIEEATAGMGIVVTEQNDQAQLRAAQSENNMKDESGALAAAPCSAPRMVLVRNKLVPDLSEEEHALADEMDKDPDFICCGNRIISCLEDFRAFESVISRSLAKNGGRPIAFYYSISRDKTN